ncbi:MAG TPA: glycosyltransferase family 39 protein [Vicinamibacteria bacterium]|nr:glycosyltransferase family 39 protein [Vicinamibacteria bacterium]
MTASDRRAAWAVLAATLALAAWGLRWGLPSEYGWAPDEVLPHDVDAAVSQRFAKGWHSKYPPLHFALLAAAGVPARAAARVTGGDDAHVRDARMTAGRLLSLLMAAGTLLALQRCGRLLGDPLAGTLAAAVLGLSVPFVYYAKTANLDVPYLFWFALSLLSLLRALGRGQARDFAWFGLSAAAAVATKDQAYALYVLTVPVLVGHLHGRRRREGAPGGLFSDRRLAAMAVTGVGGYLLLAGVLINPSGWLAHLRLIAGPASGDFRMFESSLGGRLELLWQSARHLAFAIGTPALAAAGIGVVWVWRQGSARGRWLAVLVPAASYLLFFLLVVLYVYDRFLLPVALVLALFAGAALAQALRSRSVVLRSAACLVLASAGARAVAVDLLLARDSRYAVEAWLRREVGPGPLIAAVGPLEYLPRLDGLRWRRLGPSAARLAQVRPDLVVINADYAQRAEEGTGERSFYRDLETGALGYAPAVRRRGEAQSWLLDTRPLRADGPGRIWSNIEKASPDIVVYRREDGSALSR